MHRLGYERFLAPVELRRSRSARQDDHAAHIGSNFEVVFWPSLRWPAQDTGAMGGPGRANNSMTKVGWGRDLGLVRKNETTRSITPGGGVTCVTQRLVKNVRAKTKSRFTSFPRPAISKKIEKV